MRVPEVPLTASGALSSEPMTAVRSGLPSQKRIAARTLGSMEPFPNWPLVGVRAGLGDGEVGEAPLVLRAEVDGDAVDGGEQHELVGVAVLAEQRRRHVLVDDGGDPLVATKIIGVAYHGDAAPAARDDDELVVEEVQDRVPTPRCALGAGSRRRGR